MKFIEGQKVKGCYRVAGNDTLGPWWVRQGDGPKMASSIYRHERLERARRKWLEKGCPKMEV